MASPLTTDELEASDESDSSQSISLRLPYRPTYLTYIPGTSRRKAMKVAAIMTKRGFPEFDIMISHMSWSDDALHPSSSSSSHFSPSAVSRSFRQSSVSAHWKSTKTRACLEYDFNFPSTGCEIWPDIRSSQKRPARYEPRHIVRPCYPYKHVDPTTGLTTSNGPDTSPYHWPPGRFPTELYEEIASYLSYDDVKSMRLVCREFDRHVSQVLFRTVVVKFNTELFGMLQPRHPRKQDVEGKRDTTNSSSYSIDLDQSVSLPPFLSWTNGHDSNAFDVHGLKVFKMFGPHIIQFGMSFAIQQDTLAHPPDKVDTERHKTYWGFYKWPLRHYQRFDLVAGLEITADETYKMTAAFSHLPKVQELGLSIDSGLGWLSGPDKSIRSIIVRDSPPMFGTSTVVHDRRYKAQRQLWGFLQESYSDDIEAFRKAALHRTELWAFPNLTKVDVPDMLPELQYLDPSVVEDAHLESLSSKPQSSSVHSSGLLFASTESVSEAKQCDHPLLPRILSQRQKEWLLETEWAQRAFLSSYMLSVMDNPATFENIHALTLVDLSSRFLSILTRSDFWNALPALRRVSFGIIADWRDIVMEDSGFVDMPPIMPTSSMDTFHHLLDTMIAERKGIESLNIGWTSGGEHATGVHARNKHLMPTPLWRDSKASVQALSEMLLFPHVKHLTLSNCWMTPPALVALVEKYSTAKLLKLTLDSVSTTVLPSSHPAPNVPPALQGNPPALHVLNLQAQPPPLDPLAAWKGPHRGFSWPDILDRISPGATLADYVSSSSRPNQNTTLDEIELKSCGYAKVSSGDFTRQEVLDPSPLPDLPNAKFFDARFKALAPVMMETRDVYMGEIQQWIPDTELEAMDIVWGLKSGWENNEEAEAVEFDGGWKGGTGRVSGIINRSDRERLPEPMEF